mmetsp:Transcript_110827/g.308698  ORF Transcript_110827/g.308698 Transcript_110827/m.308698 type:complete len:236 (-) Transcript_110827:141-848(-)
METHRACMEPRTDRLDLTELLLVLPDSRLALLTLVVQFLGSKLAWSMAKHERHFSTGEWVSTIDRRMGGNFQIGGKTFIQPCSHMDWIFLCKCFRALESFLAEDSALPELLIADVECKDTFNQMLSHRGVVAWNDGMFQGAMSKLQDDMDDAMELAHHERHGMTQGTSPDLERIAYEQAALCRVYGRGAESQHFHEEARGHRRRYEDAYWEAMEEARCYQDEYGGCDYDDFSGSD